MDIIERKKYFKRNFNQYSLKESQKKKKKVKFLPR